MAEYEIIERFFEEGFYVHRKDNPSIYFRRDSHEEAMKNLSSHQRILHIPEGGRTVRFRMPKLTQEMDSNGNV